MDHSSTCAGIDKVFVTQCIISASQTKRLLEGFEYHKDIYFQAARCQLDDASNILEISWKPPLNLNYIKHERVVYEVIAYGVPFEDLASLDYLSEFSTSDTKIQLPLKNILKHWKIQINIVALLDQGLNSAETIIACDL